MQTVRERMLHVLDLEISVMERIADKKEAKPEELALLPALADSICRITSYAVIEAKN